MQISFKTKKCAPKAIVRVSPLLAQLWTLAGS